MRVMSHLRHRRVNRSRAVLIAVAVASASCLAVPGAALAGTLDQQQTDISGAGQGVNNNGVLSISAAQTFTAGISGGLDQVDLSLAKNGSPVAALTVELQSTIGLLPDGTVLGTQTVPASSVTSGSSLAFVPVVFPTPVPVVAGTQYAIVAYVADTNGYNWGASPDSSPDPSAYSGGEAFFASSSPPSTTWIPFTGDLDEVDQAFRTYVAPPTPSAPPSSPTPPTSAPTGQRAAALKKCKRKRTKQARRKCRKKASKLPV
jgi:hypothetical protein